MVINEDEPRLCEDISEPLEKLEDPEDSLIMEDYHVEVPDESAKADLASILERDVYKYCLQQVADLSVPMKLVAVERQFNESKIVVFFTAEGRVDFRELVKNLVKQFRIRIEMRQIGVRHQAKMVGGVAPCGRPLCCATYLSEFAPVTIKTAKDQNLSLNPTKISGMCGRLMCCLTFEHKYYKKKKKLFPKIGKKIVTDEGEGKVIRQNILKDTFFVQLESGEIIEKPLNESEKEIAPKKKTKE